MEIQVGKQSLAFAEAPYIISSASIVGKKEGEGPLGNRFDVDGRGRQVRTEHLGGGGEYPAEGSIYAGGRKSGLKTEDIRYLFSGDLLGQNIATSFGLMDYQVPLFGLYGACAPVASALIGRDVRGGGVCGLCCGDDVRAIFASAEKQFRFPLEYANQRPKSATWTVTGSGAYVLGKKRSKARITGITTGKIVDYGIKDSMNMGAAMAPPPVT